MLLYFTIKMVDNGTEKDLQKSDELDDLNKLSDKEAVYDINFSKTNNVLLELDEIPNPINPKEVFDKLISWQIKFDELSKKERKKVWGKKIRKSVSEYIKDSLNEKHVLTQYLQHIDSIPDIPKLNIREIIEKTYTKEQIWEHELQLYFAANDIISIWKNINGNDWDGSNISQNNQKISEIWKYFTPGQFIHMFNEKNGERITNNINILKEINLQNLATNGLKVEKNRWVLYINGKEIWNKSILWNEDFLNVIMRNEGLSNVVSINELNNMLHSIYTDKEDKALYEKIYNTVEESNENYKFHDTWLNFLTEPVLLKEDEILKNFIKNSKPGESIEKARSNNPELSNIMSELEIKDGDTPDTKYEKSRLIYLLNNGLFRWFLLAIDCLRPGGVECEKSSPYLNDVAYKWLQAHLKRYQTEKDEQHFQLINDINNININFNSNFISNEIGAHLRQSQKRKNVENVVSLAKSFFIQRIKDWQTENKNIKTYKNQLAYILTTMQLESGYMYNAITPSWTYRWYWQINKKYTGLRTIFAQGSWLDIWLRDKGTWKPILWADIKVTEQTFLDENFSAYAFIYGLTYWHFSNQWNLDRYINDGNVNNPDFVNARKVEAWVNSPAYTRIADQWRKIIDDSITK